MDRLRFNFIVLRSLVTYIVNQRGHRGNLVARKSTARLLEMEYELDEVKTSIFGETQEISGIPVVSVLLNAGKVADENIDRRKQFTQVF